MFCSTTIFFFLFICLLSLHATKQLLAASDFSQNLSHSFNFFVRSFHFFMEKKVYLWIKNMFLCIFFSSIFFGSMNSLLQYSICKYIHIIRFFASALSNLQYMQWLSIDYSYAQRSFSLSRVKVPKSNSFRWVFVARKMAKY